METPLEGPVVILTRPAGRNEPLAQVLRQAGVRAHVAPALRIDWLEPAGPSLYPGDLAVFVSRQAVEAYFRSARGWPDGVWAAAVGSATATALKDHVPGSWVLAPDRGQPPDSEALCEVLDRQLPQAACAHILRADHGRAWLGQALRQRGWRVQYHALYRRSPCLWAESTARLLARGRDTILLLTSREAFQAIDASLRHYRLGWPVSILRVVTLHARIVQPLELLYDRIAPGCLAVTYSAPDDSALSGALLSAKRSAEDTNPS